MNRYYDVLLLFAQFIDANYSTPSLAFTAEDLAAYLDLPVKAIQYLLTRAVYAGVLTRSVEEDTGREWYGFDSKFTNWFQLQRAKAAFLTHHGFPVTVDAVLCLARADMEGGYFLKAASDMMCKANRDAMNAQVTTLFGKEDK